MKSKSEKIQNNYGSPRWSGEILDCSMPMTFDQYDHCSYNCMYCFSYFQKALKAINPLFPHHAGKAYQAQEIRSVNVKKVKKIFTGETKSQFVDYIKHRITFQWGGLSDPFDEFERKHGVGLELLRFFKEINYPICFSTKAVWWLYDKRYRELFKGQENWNCKFSIISLDEARCKIVEAGCPSPFDRLKAIRDYTDLNAGGATLRLRPFIIGLSDKSYMSLIAQAAEHGATALSTEFFCLEQRGAADKSSGLGKRYARMSEAIGFDILTFYRHNSRGASGYLRLNWKIKEPYINKMESLCKKFGLRYYVSDAHHKDRCNNGSCCGLSPEWKYQRGQFTEMLCLAKSRRTGKVYWKDMAKHIGMFKNFQWRKAEGFNTKGTRERMTRYGQTMFDYIHEIWNTPNNAKSPYKYFQGLLLPIGLDENQDVIYRYQSYNEM